MCNVVVCNNGSPTAAHRPSLVQIEEEETLLEIVLISWLVLHFQLLQAGCVAVIILAVERNLLSAFRFHFSMIEPSLHTPPSLITSSSSAPAALQRRSSVHSASICQIVRLPTEVVGCSRANSHLSSLHLC